MNAGEMWGWIGGIMGGIGGLAGGITGTYFSIRNTHGPKERRFAIKASMIAWAAVSLFLGLLFIIPQPYRWLLWIPYAILLGPAIVAWNQKQARIRTEEANR